MRLIDMVHTKKAGWDIAFCDVATIVILVFTGRQDSVADIAENSVMILIGKGLAIAINGELLAVI